MKTYAAAEVSLKHVNFLLADGSDGARKVLRSILNRFGAHSVKQARSIREAMSYLDSGKIDIMICDLMLEDGSGAEMVRDLRYNRRHPARHIPILMTCGHLTANDVMKCRDSGVNIILTKPISVSVLYDRLCFVAHHGRPFVEHENYCGPCRRFKAEGGPKDIERRTDLTKLAAAPPGDAGSNDDKSQAEATA